MGPAEDFDGLLQLGKSVIEEMADSDSQFEEIFNRFFPQKDSARSHPLNYKDPYQIIVDNLPHKVFLKNLDSVYLTCNRQFADFLNISQSDIVGKTDNDLFPDALAMQFQYEDRLTLEQGSPCQYILEYLKNDRKLFLQIMKIPIHDKNGKNIGIIGVIFEITDTISFRKIVEDGKLHKDLIAENNSDVFYKIDYNGADNYISKNIIRLTGYTQEEQLQMRHDEFIEKDSVKVFDDLMNFYMDALKGKVSPEDRPKYYRRADIELKLKDGGTVWVESVTNLYFLSTGEVNGIVGIYRNIHDRKMLEFKVQETLEKSKILSQTQSQIISTISHEFKTPISVLQSNLQLLVKHRNNLNDSLLDDIFDLSLEAIQAINSTLNNISFLAKNQKGAFNLAKEEINLNQFIKKIVRELVCIPEYSNRIIFTNKLNRTHFDLDPKMMKHILTNLLINGLNYSLAPRKVKLNVEERSDHLHFSVKDEGIGIPEEDIEHVFESFYRAGNVNGIKGSGLGLAIVKECINLYDGKIKVASKRDEGTEVEFTIPICHE